LKQSKEKRVSPDKKGVILAFFLSILWSGNPISIKIGLEDAPPLRLGWMRFLLGGIVAILWAIYNKEKFQIHKREILPLLGVGALFSIQLGFMNVGQNFTSGGHGVIMITTFPLWSSIFSHIFVPNDKLTKLKILGMIIAYGGIIILFWESLRDSKSDYFLGDILMLTSAMLLGARQIYISQIAQGISQINILLSQAIIGIISFFIFSTILETENYIYSVSLALALFYQGIIIAGFGFIGQTWLLKNYLPSKVTIISLSQPVFGVFLAWIILNETPGIELVFATILVVIGSYISVKK
jgi:drug/metabolite transporter (DMT)-like permease|tara:strand:- start:6400 stop:7290 length:891 start_codon:yes stop_codon:yes gene_type:complete